MHDQGLPESKSPLEAVDTRMAKSFKKFLEEKEERASTPFINSLKDEFGVGVEDLGVQKGTFLQMGLGSNLWTYKVVGVKKDRDGKATHAVVKPISMDKAYKDEDGKTSRVPPQEDAKERLIPIEDLDGLLQQDFQPQGQAPM